MALDQLIAHPITSIQPFDELAIDASIWREAHNQHNLHRRVHAVSTHRPGIVHGLEVMASTTKEHTVIVAPGVGIDSDGQTIILSEPQSIRLEEKGQIYIVICFEPSLDGNSTVTVAGGQQQYRRIEGRKLMPTKQLPSEPYLELARIYRSGAEKPVKDAVAQPFDPRSDELNLLHRPVVFPHCHADASVGELPYVPLVATANWKPNRAGLWNLLREGNGRGFHLEFSTPYDLRKPAAAPPALLYMSGGAEFQPLTEEELEGLRRFLSEGGLLFGEASGGSEAFAAGFRDLATKAGAALTPVAAGDKLLTAHYMFSAPPIGAQENGALTADLQAGVVFSSFDYGAAWQGEVPRPKNMDARERIRQAQEFGLNLIALAARRRRMYQLSRLG